MHIKVGSVVWEGDNFLLCHNLFDFVEGGLLFILPNPFGFGADHRCEGIDDACILCVHFFVMIYHTDKLAEFFLVLQGQDFMNLFDLFYCGLTP